MKNKSKVNEGRFESNYASFMVLFAILLGGGTEQNLWSDHLIQVMMVPHLFLGFYRLPLGKLNGWIWFTCVFSIQILIWQFLPLQREFELPNSNVISTQLFWTASPSRAIESALFFTTCLGLFFYIISISMPTKMKILKVVLIAVLIHSIVAVFQLSYSSSIEILGLLPFTITSGLFANSNHFSTLLFTTIPILGYVYLSFKQKFSLFVFLSILIIMLLFAINSRAGMAFAFVQLLLSLLWFFSQNVSPKIRVSVFASCAIIGVFVLYFLDFSSTLEGDLRSEIFETTWRAIKDNWFFGSGLGTFVLLYPSYERVDQIFTYYINHAHNDYLELLLEMGVFVLIPIALFTGFVIRYIFTHKETGILGIGLLAVLAHSFLDYPLRTFSVALTFAIIAALFFQKEV